MDKDTCGANVGPNPNAQHSHKKPDMSPHTCNPSTIMGRERRMAGVCWLSIKLQAKWGTLSQENKVESDRAGPWALSGHVCPQTHMCIYHIHTWWRYKLRKDKQ